MKKIFKDRHRLESLNQEESTYNPLLMYLMQNRADDFIERFKQSKRVCYFGVLMLHHVAYANKILLSIPDWQEDFKPILSKCRTDNNRILEYLKSTISFPKYYQKGFAEFLKSFARYPKKYGFKIEDILGDILPNLVEMGYREIDCLLYEAGMKFNFNRIIDLLSEGANPYVHISGDYSPETAAKLDWQDVKCLYEDAERYMSDCIDMYGVAKCWIDGVNRKETKDDNVLENIFEGAGMKMVYDICERYSH